MAEGWRTDAARRNLQNSMSVPEPNDPLGEAPLDVPELPETASPASNLALNRSAEALGRGVGNAVAGVRRLPRQIDKLRSRIHLVPRDDRVASMVEDVRDSAVEVAEEWRHAAETSLAELQRRAELYTGEVAAGANRHWADFRLRAEGRVNALRHEVRQWLSASRRWKSDQPLKVIGACAAMAFVAGVALRIWRSNRD